MQPFLKRELPGDESRCFYELQVGAVIPDLLFVQLPKAKRKRLDFFGRASFFDAFVVAELSRQGSLSCEELSERLFVQPARVVESVRKLRRLGLVRMKSDRYVLVAGRFPLSARVVAVEAKLIKWRDAVEQAKSYLQFSNKSYVAVPEELVGLRELRAECRHSGLGLIGVGRDSVRVELRGRFRKVNSPSWAWIVMRAWEQRRSHDA
ncbi:hypothetical protein [Pyxidicoccus caerfyrddinensis]|uniref:hypothetical protein n=1 Tax=Pyxidicoccus caerfyrddinensis TaxID=2709663 RepID=UPI0013DC583A|nr:hypothetical protein [Pyxidicoccus caerfyrddinensis]